MKFRAETTGPTPQDGCRELWAAVLGNAIDDLKCRDDQIRQSAERWFSDNDPRVGGFRWVCTMLDLRVSLVRETAKSRIASNA